jgi:uncharacterized membrane protein
MNLSLVIHAPLAVKVHLATVLPAIALGTWMMFVSRKSSSSHRVVGKTYLLLLSITATAGLFIRAPEDLAVEIGPLRLGFIHLFIPLTAWGVYSAFASVRRGDIVRHQNAMRGLYYGGMIVAGLLAFVPPRLLWRVFIR